MSYLIEIILLFYASLLCNVQIVWSSCSLSLTSESEVELHGFVYKSFQISQLRDCFTKCIEERICQSINYNIQQYSCQFNKEIKRNKPERMRAKYLGVYMENPKRANRGSHPTIAGHSCKEINDLGESNGDGEYWIDPANSGQPFKVYCDMTTDSGGWTLIRRAKLIDNNPNAHARTDPTDYRAISNYNDFRQNVQITAIQKLRLVMGFHQIRYKCHKKTIGRTLHLMTTNDSAGHRVLDHFLVSTTWPTACNSFRRFPDDTSILSQNCLKWGYYVSSKEVNRWGYYTNTGNWRIYNNAIVWAPNHGLVFWQGGSYECDDRKDSASYGALSAGDLWELYVR